jgi:hypothetical protein
VIEFVGLPPKKSGNLTKDVPEIFNHSTKSGHSSNELQKIGHCPNFSNIAQKIWSPTLTIRKKLIPSW